MFSKLMEKIKNHIINLKLFYMRKKTFQYGTVVDSCHGIICFV